MTQCTPILFRAEANTRFARIFARLYSCLNARKGLRYTAYVFGVVILAYFVNIYIFKAILEKYILHISSLNLSFCSSFKLFDYSLGLAFKQFKL